jgi:hypothetical protein
LSQQVDFRRLQAPAPAELAAPIPPLRRTRRLAFALVERAPNPPAIVLFKNKHHTLTIMVLQDPLQVAAYARLAANLKALTHVAGQSTFLESKKFARFISL